MAVTPETTAEVLAVFSKNPQRFSPFKTSKALGIPIEDVLKIVEDNRETASRGAERFGGLGRPELQPFTVARRKAMSGGWNNNDPAIAKAREDYEAGTIELATGRDGAYLILYAIPRTVVQPRPKYFSTETI